PDQRRLTRAFRIASHYLTHGAAKRRFFLGALPNITRAGLTWPKIVAALSFLPAPKHLPTYVSAGHGDPHTGGASVAPPPAGRAGGRTVGRYGAPRRGGGRGPARRQAGDGRSSICDLTPALGAPKTCPIRENGFPRSATTWMLSTTNWVSFQGRRMTALPGR